MYNKLFIIGNGFDLAHGLKTKYSDFILWYLNNAYETFITKRYYEDKLIKFNIYKNFPIKEFISIKDFKEYSKLQGVYPEIKYNFFGELMEQLSELNWVDIEFKYYREILKIYRYLEKENIDESSYATIQLLRLNECFEVLKQMLVEYLKTIEITPEIIIPEIQSHFNSIIKTAKDSRKKVLILNFNYTTTVNEYLKTTYQNDISNINIHGELNSEDNPIIFGYGDEMDIFYEKIERLNSNEFLKNFKSFGYFRTNNLQQIRSIVYGNYEVFIMGHSCGLSDRVLLNSIFENNKCRSIKIFYHDKVNNKNDYFEKTIEISRHFRSESKGIMRNIILSFDKCEPLIKHTEKE